MPTNDSASSLILPFTTPFPPTNTVDNDRRSFLKGALGVGAGILFAPTLFIPRFVNATEKIPERALSLYNINTGEHLKKCVFWAEGKIIEEGQGELNKFFRDFRTGEQKEIDPELLNLLHQLSLKLETNEPFHLISGYRSKKTNAALRKKSKGVARNSQHPLGKAADFSVPGRTLKAIQSLAKDFKLGGVGRYSRFVHVDTGPVRHW